MLKLDVALFLTFQHQCKDKCITYLQPKSRIIYAIKRATKEGTSYNGYEEVIVAYWPEQAPLPHGTSILHRRIRERLGQRSGRNTIYASRDRCITTPHWILRCAFSPWFSREQLRPYTWPAVQRAQQKGS